MALVVLRKQQPPVEIAPPPAGSFSFSTSSRFWNSFSFSQTGIAMRNEAKPFGAKAR